MRINEYIELLTEQIRCKKAHPMIAEEYKAHIEDQAEAFRECGMEEAEAEEAAVAQMGDPVEAGVELDRVHRPKMCKSLILTVFVLTVIGIVIQSILFKSVDNVTVRNEYFGRTIFYNVIGFAVMAGICYLDYSFWYKHMRKLCAGWCVGMVVLLFAGNVFAGIPYYTRWMLPYQFTALFALVYAVVLFGCRNQGLQGFVKAMIPLLFSVPLVCLGHKATGIVEMYLVIFSLWTFAILKGWYGGKRVLKVALMWVIAVVAPILAVANYMINYPDSYKTARIRGFLNPTLYSMEEGYVTMQIRKVIAGFSPFGHASSEYLAESLPGIYNDFTLLSIFAYFGVIIGVLVCLLFAFFFVKAFRVSFKQKNQLAQIMGIGCIVELLVRVVIYTASNFGVCPFAQMNMPFLSFGISGILVNSVLTGVLLSIYRYENVLSEKQMRQEKAKYRIRIEKVDA